MKQEAPGIYATLWDWIKTTRDGKSTIPDMQQVLYPEETLRLIAPKSVHTPLHPAFRASSLYVPKAYVGVLPQGRYRVADNGEMTITAPDGKPVRDVSLQYERSKRRLRVEAEEGGPPPVKTEETVAVLSFVWDSNYYHWLGEVLARLHLLERSGIAIDQYIINRKGSASFQMETLSMLGIPRSKTIRSRKGMHLQAKRLVVPSLEMFRLEPFVPHALAPWACRYLRQRLLRIVKPEPLPGFERIYISRADAKVRPVTNEDALYGILAARGYRKVTLAGMPVAEQVRLFASAQAIVAPHGAGLANLMFCRPGTQVLELYAPGYMNPVYWYLSCQTGLDYYYAVGRGEPQAAHTAKEDVEGRTDSITVDPDLLHATLKLMEAGEKHA
ncbi:DUF563 domain-containing protein [Paenibacillus hodogayensis]|uniref:DUF563 domain-containing protein n=1 Tax=Paenibacillus hodogayensis TaxID=279208 RepID=A0ABV5VSX3_9BACL